MTTQLPPPGWYPDPAGSGRVRYFNGGIWTDQYAPPPPPVAVRAPSRSRRMTPRAQLIFGIVLVVIGLGLATTGAVTLTSSHYGQPGAVVCNGHPMQRDEICQYHDYAGKRGPGTLFVENYDQKLAHQKKDAHTWPGVFLGLGLFWALVGGLLVWLSKRHRRGRLPQPPQPG